MSIKKGNVQIKIVLPGSPATDVSLYKVVNAGWNFIAWDGKDKLGNMVPDGTPITIEITYVNGLTNLPLWDIEQNYKGFVVTLIRPINPDISSPKVFWDDRSLSGGTACPAVFENTAGCEPTIVGLDTTGCHVWGTGSTECHDKMINTWWYSASTSTSTITNTHEAMPPLPVGTSPVDRCGIGDVDVSATVLPGEIVRWWDVPSGGSAPLATSNSGIPYTITLSTTGTTHIYAEAYNPASLCASDPPRADFVLNAFPIPASPTGSTTVLQCGPGQVTITANTVPDVRIDWYDAASGGSLLSSSNPFVTPFLSATTTYYAEAVDNASNCISTSRTAFTASINPLPTASISERHPFARIILPHSSPLPVAPPQNLTPLPITSMADLIRLSPQWQGIRSQYPPQPILPVLSLITSSVSGKGSTAACNQLQPGSATITVNALTTPTLNGESPVCLGVPGKVYTTQASKTNYLWTYPAEATKTAGGTTTDNTITLTWNTVGNYDINVNYTEPTTGCTAETPTPYNVTVNPLPTATISGTTSVCQNAAAPLITFTGADATAPYTFTYKINGGTRPGGYHFRPGTALPLPLPPQLWEPSCTAW